MISTVSHKGAMYRNEDEFVRGQKIKLVLTVVMLMLAYLLRR